MPELMNDSLENPSAFENGQLKFVKRIREFTSEKHFPIHLEFPDWNLNYDRYYRAFTHDCKKYFENLPEKIIDNEQLECKICSMYFNRGDKVKVLQCCHVYHGEFFISWLKYQNSSPMYSCVFIKCTVKNI